MRPTLETDVMHEGNLGKNRVAFSIDTDDPRAVAHIMSELTDLYSDLVMAAIREPCSNAQDSHIRAGQTRPIEVTLPTDLDPVFTVRDWGTGLTEQEFLEEYSKFGWSNKRDNDEETGMLGFGCKAPLTYVSQFTVSAVKDGRQVDVLVNRGDDGQGGLEPVSNRKTNKPNGVEVIIPCKENRDEFIQRAMFFFGFWAPGSVLVDGKEPPKHMDDERARVLDPDVVLHPGIGQDYVVMGNVPYPVGRYLSGMGMSGNAIVRVPVGAVVPTPPRESLKMVPRTKETLSLASDFIRTSLTRVAQKDVDSKPTAGEAYESIKKWKGVHRDIKLTYRGRRIPGAISLDSWGFSYRPATDNGGIFGEYSGTHMEPAKKVVWVLGYTNKTFTRIHKEKLKKYVEGVQSLENETFYLGESLPDPFWLDDVRTLQWEDIAKQKVDLSQRPTEKRPVGWEVVLPGGYHPKTIHDPDFKGKIVVSSGPGMYNDASTARRAFPDDVTILLLHPNRVDKFMREHKNAILLEDAVRLELQRFPHRLTPMQAELMNFDWKALRCLENVRADDVLDPRLTEFLRAAEGNEARVLKDRWLTLLRLPYSGRWRRREIESSDKMQEYIRKRYPLLFSLDHHGRTRGRDIANYINALYKTRQGEGK